MPLRQAPGQPLASNIASQRDARSPSLPSAPRYNTSGSRLLGMVPSSAKTWVSILDDRVTTSSLIGNLAKRVLYRDGLILVVDKPAGIAVHAGPGGGPHLEHWFPLLRFGLPRPPALAHRLDRDTSGCLVLGRHPKALRRLGRLFAEGRVEKVYWAVVAGVPAAPEGRIEAALADRKS